MIEGGREEEGVFIAPSRLSLWDKGKSCEGSSCPCRQTRLEDEDHATCHGHALHGWMDPWRASELDRVPS